ncbi:hypothetical protein [Luteimonas sp. A482]
MSKRLFVALAVAVTLLALILRLHYVLAVTVVNPLGGDALDYVRYADNLLRGYFGREDAPDAYRSPGYPVLIAGAKALAADWPALLLVWQAGLGSLTVAGTMMLARTWLPAWSALVAGLLLALWPHSIAMTAEVLSETLFAFLLMLAALLAARRQWLTAGFAFAAGALVNPVVLLLPLALVPCLRERRAIVALLVPALLVPSLWSFRPVDGGSERLWTNLVQGSWPLYHRAYLSRNAHPEPAQIMATIDGEVLLTNQYPVAGVTRMLERMSQSPLGYAGWYAGKPYLLWDWDIRISDAHGPYVHAVENSPLDKRSAWLAVGKAMNPVLFWLALAACVHGLWKGPAPLRMVAVAFAYFTLLHTVLQAEPRYSVPYRPFEMLLVASIMAATVARLASRFGHGMAPAQVESGVEPS